TAPCEQELLKLTLGRGASKYGLKECPAASSATPSNTPLDPLHSRRQMTLGGVFRYEQLRRATRPAPAEGVMKPVVTGISLAALALSVSLAAQQPGSPPPPG